LIYVAAILAQLARWHAPQPSEETHA
jgi:hypothetical protein